MNPHDYLDFSNRVVLVTGSSRGIGYATAELFAEHGARVIINSVNKESLERAASNLGERGYAVSYRHADVSHPQEAHKMIASIIDAFGKIDVLINNAGIIKRNILIEEHSDKDWKTIMETNLGGVFYVSRAVIPFMKQKKGGVIVNISSQTAIFGSKCAIAYPVSKGGVISFTKALTQDVGAFNIRVNAVAPGLIKTDMTKWTENSSAEYEKINLSTPLRRVGSSLEVASVCLFLASDMASYVTGQVITVNGGRPSLLFL